jgi:hypothetical protein
MNNKLTPSSSRFSADATMRPPAGTATRLRASVDLGAGVAGALAKAALTSGRSRITRAHTPMAISAIDHMGVFEAMTSSPVTMRTMLPARARPRLRSVRMRHPAKKTNAEPARPSNAETTISEPLTTPICPR